ncbi:MAG: GFA family protein, partial [Rhizobiales bacterium]|nr:GFA family protein [Hyphomicrobiales bacterium]
MTESANVTGGCQCGQVRYAISGPFENPHICHCRMCQKAFGNYFAALVGAKKTDFKWTRGKPGV